MHVYVSVFLSLMPTPDLLTNWMESLDAGNVVNIKTSGRYLFAIRIDMRKKTVIVIFSV